MAAAYPLPPQRALNERAVRTRDDCAVASRSLSMSGRGAPDTIRHCVDSDLYTTKGCV